MWRVQPSACRAAQTLGGFALVLAGLSSALPTVRGAVLLVDKFPICKAGTAPSFSVFSLPSPTVKRKTAAQYTDSTPDNGTLQPAEASNITTVLIKTGQHMERKKHAQRGFGKKTGGTPIHSPLALLICLPAEDSAVRILSLSEIL